MHARLARGHACVLQPASGSDLWHADMRGPTFDTVANQAADAFAHRKPKSTAEQCTYSSAISATQLSADARLNTSTKRAAHCCSIIFAYYGPHDCADVRSE